MRVFQIHNRHSVQGGSEIMFDSTVALLKKFGHEVIVIERSNQAISGTGGRIKAAASGIYSRSAKANLAKILASARPNIVHIHNVYPLLSPSVLDACDAALVPVVMRLADFTLLCPTSHHFRKGAVCQRCLGGKEYQCVLVNCRGSLMISFAYALRTTAARLRRCFMDKVTSFIAPTNFVRDRFIAAGFAAEKISVIPNLVEIPRRPATPEAGNYVAYVGRVSPEKGIDVLLKASRSTSLPVKIAGDISAMPGIREGAPRNVEFVGNLNREQLAEFVRNARFCVVPSIGLEAFGLACAEVMAHGVPVIASRIGGLPELVTHQENGILFEAGNDLELVARIEELWHNPEMITRLGGAAREKAATEFSETTHYRRLLALYQAAAEKNGRASAD